MIASFSNKFGRIDLFLESGTIDTYTVVAHGVIGLGLLRKYLEHLQHLDANTSSPFNHVVDTTRVKIANPLNPFYLRSISKLKNINLYIVIVPSKFLRFLVGLTKWINKPDYVLQSIEEVNFDVLRGKT